MKKYYKIPVLNGDVDNEAYRAAESVQNTPDLRYVAVSIDHTPGPGWVEVSESEFNIVKDQMDLLKKTFVLTAQTQTVAVNTVLTINLAIRNWKNEVATYEDRPVIIKIAGPGQPAELTLTPVNGQVEFDFESPIPGTFAIRAEAAYPCDSVEMEVVVNG